MEYKKQQQKVSASSILKLRGQKRRYIHFKFKSSTFALKYLNFPIE